MPLALKEIHPVAHATERQLVRAVRDGDDRAFEQLFSRYRRRITAYVHGLVNDHGRAEDLTQEVFISALRRLRETEGPISFKPWIYEIARNACIDEFRRVSRTSVISLDLGLEPDSVPTIQLADHATPEVRWERKQQIGNLFGAFSSLPDNQHRVLVLRELEGLSYGEIGDRMGMSRPMVESTLFRARRRLSEEYDELASGRRCLDVQAAVDGQETRGIATLGIRERRRIARHLNHCTDCLRYARMAGIDDSVLRVPAPARRVAALLPFGWLRLAWRRARGKAPGHGASSVASGASQAAAVSKLAAAAAALLITGGGLAAIVHAHGSPQGAAVAPSAPVTGHDIGLRGAPFGAGSTGSTGQSAANRAAAAGASATAGLRPGSMSAEPGVSAPRTGATPSPTANGGRASGGTLAGLGSATPSGLGLRSPLGTVVSRTTGTVDHVVSTLPSTISGVVSKVPSTVGGVVSKVPSTVGGVVPKVPSTAGGAVSKVPATVGTVATGVPSTAGGLVPKAPSSVAPAPTAIAPAPTGTPLHLPQGLSGIVGTAPPLDAGLG